MLSLLLYFKVIKRIVVSGLDTFGWADELEMVNHCKVLFMS